MIVRRLLPALILSTYLVAPALAQQPTQSPPTPARISVTGEGNATAAPDLAVTQLTVLRSAATAAEAVKAVNEASAQLVAAMPDFGIEKRDLQTSGFQISPQYRYENREDGTQAPPVLTGYEVRNTLTVKVRDLARLGELLDRSVQLGVNEGGSISFQIDDMTGILKTARTNAVTDARENAEALAQAAGLKLGRVVTIDQSSGSMPFPPPPMPAPMGEMRAAAGSAKVPIETGENTVTAQVQVTYELINETGN